MTAVNRHRIHHPFGHKNNRLGRAPEGFQRRIQIHRKRSAPVPVPEPHPRLPQPRPPKRNPFPLGVVPSAPNYWTLSTLYPKSRQQNSNSKSTKNGNNSKSKSSTEDKPQNKDFYIWLLLIVGVIVIMTFVAVAMYVLIAIPGSKPIYPGGDKTLPPQPSCDYQLQPLREQIASLETQLLICRSSTCRPYTNPPIPDEPSAPTSLFNIPCPIISKTEDLWPIFQNKSGRNRLEIVLRNSALNLLKCKIVSVKPTGPTSQPTGGSSGGSTAEPTQISSFPLNLVPFTQTDTSTLLQLCVPSDDKAMKSTSSMYTFLNTLKDKSTSKNSSDDPYWFFPKTCGLTSDYCSPDIKTCANLTDKVNRHLPYPYPVPVSSTGVCPQMVYYLPFSIGTEDLSQYNKRGTLWKFFFVADAVASLYMDGVYITSTVRTDDIRNIDGSCTGIFTNYPGSPSSYSTWNPSLGEHLLAVVLTPFLPAWRVGFSLVAFQMNGTDDNNTEKYPVFASVSQIFNKNSTASILIATTFENENDGSIIKWLSMTCNNN